MIDCEPNSYSIRRALEKLYSSSFQNQLVSVQNPYGEEGASETIVKTLEKYPLENLLKKEFHDLLDWAFTGIKISRSRELSMIY